MSTIWTPSGEHTPDDEAVAAPPPGPDTTEAEPDAAEPDAAERAAAEEEMARVAAELLGTPVDDIIANHAIGLWQLAVLHISQEDPDLVAAQLAIDALGQLVEGLGERLGESSAPLADALAQLRVAYVQRNQQSES